MTFEMKLAHGVYDELFSKAISKFGEDLQLDIAIEEMAELTKEIIKLKRRKGNTIHIAEEIADVLIMMQQVMIIINDRDGEMVERAIKEKIKRLKVYMSDEAEGEQE